MQLKRIRVNNAVAPLGGAWTESQMEQFKKYATKVCFLPDADPPNFEKGEKLGAGIRNTMRNGLLAMKSDWVYRSRSCPWEKRRARMTRIPIVQDTEVSGIKGGRFYSLVCPAYISGCKHYRRAERCHQYY